MLIARLIADRADLLTRIEQLKHTLEAEGLPMSVSADELNAGALLEIQTMGTAEALFAASIEFVFPHCDRLIARDEMKIPSLFVSDMDSTMIEQECIDELADFAGIKKKVADITERAMLGELDFEDALRERVKLLRGLDETVITTCLNDRISLMPGAQTLVKTLRLQGCRTVLVTGGFHHFADEIAQSIGFERVVGNRLAVAEGKLTGGLDGPITDSSVKRAVLEEEQGILPAGAASLASGDGANDIPMLDAADYGFAYRAKPKARDAANGRIDQGDLTTILHLLKIPQSDWVTS